MTGKTSVPPPDARWDAIAAYAQAVDGYRLAGSFDRCAEVANHTLDDYRATGTLPHDAKRLRIALFFEVRRYSLMGPDRGDEMSYIRALVGALADVREQGAA